MVFDLRLMNQFQSNQIQNHLVFNQSRHQFQRILWSSSTESRLMFNVPNSNKSIIQCSVPIKPNPESSGLRLKVDKPIQNESIPESSGLPFNVNDQIQNTVDKSIPNESIPESSDLDLMTMNHNLLAINQIQTKQIQYLLVFSHV